MRIVVTGGCGFIGSSFVHLCKNLGHEVLVIDKMKIGYQWILNY